MTMNTNAKSAIDKLSKINYSIGSEVEFAMDRLASALAEEFKVKRNRFFRTLTLSDVLVEVAKMYPKRSPDFSESLKQAADLADDVVLALKRVYDEELDDEDQEEVARIVKSLQSKIEKTLELKP